MRKAQAKKLPLAPDPRFKDKQVTRFVNCLMIGGNKEPVERLRPIFETLAPAPDKRWGDMGPHGAGHFVKMLHNGIK